ncbi:hypothetical protein ABXT70_02050 [Candidatus Njordibacter sp. Uisw_039]
MSSTKSPPSSYPKNGGWKRMYTAAVCVSVLFFIYVWGEFIYRGFG